MLKLPETLDAAHARVLFEDLTKRRGRALTLDASAVNRISALAFEVVIAAERQWAKDEQPFEWSAVSPAMSDAWAALGLPAGQIANAPTTTDIERVET